MCLGCVGFVKIEFIERFFVKLEVEVVLGEISFGLGVRRLGFRLLSCFRFVVGIYICFLFFLDFGFWVGLVIFGFFLVLLC